MKMACTGKVYLFVGLGTIWLGLSSGFGNFKEYDEMEKKWDECGFPSKEIFSNDTDQLKACKRDDIGMDVQDLCNIFVDFTYHQCENSPKRELMKKAKFATEFFQTSNEFYLCDENLGVRIPEGIRTRFKDESCKHACSEFEGEHVCRLLVIFAMIDYKSLESAVKQFNLRKRLETSPNVSQSTPASATETKPTNGVRTNATTEAPPKSSSETPRQQHASENPKAQSTLHGTSSITYGTLAVYGIFILTILVGLYILCHFRKALLSCLRDDNNPASPTEDGKGKYKKIPAFERIVPSLDDQVKAKSYIY